MNPSNDHTRKRVSSEQAFSFVELLVASAIVAITVTVAVIAFGAIHTGGNRGGTSLDVSLPAGVLANFYGLGGTEVNVSSAPDFGEIARAEGMRDTLHEDLKRAVAVFCLARSGRSTVRPETINLATNFSPQATVRPSDFRALLGAGAVTFTDYQGAATNLANTSLFILQASTNSAVANVRAIYEMDMVSATDPAGIYASVRRYEGSRLTSFYHVFYEGTNANSFVPPVVFFDRSILAATGNPTVDSLRQAANMPFYFCWWPDPATARFWELQTPATNSPRNIYTQMAGRTSFFFVIPAFPAL